jgi:hypothetical protein
LGPRQSSSSTIQKGIVQARAPGMSCGPFAKKRQVLTGSIRQSKWLKECNILILFF